MVRVKRNSQSNDILLNDFQIEYLSKKTDKFDNEIIYLKAIGTSNTKLKKTVIDDSLKYPVWRSESGEYILKVKDRWWNSAKTFQNGDILTLDLTFKFYDYNGLKGFYAVVLGVVEVGAEDN